MMKRANNYEGAPGSSEWYAKKDGRVLLSYMDKLLIRAVSTGVKAGAAQR